MNQEAFKVRTAHLKVLVGDLDDDCYVLVAKLDGAPENAWRFLLTASNLELLREVAKFLAWRHEPAKCEYLIVQGKTAEPKMEAFRAYFLDSDSIPV